MDDFDIGESMWEMLSVPVPVYQRRCCIKHDVRVHTEIDCLCLLTWNHARQWCDNCGRTLRESIERLRPCE